MERVRRAFTTVLPLACLLALAVFVSACGSSGSSSSSASQQQAIDQAKKEAAAEQKHQDDIAERLRVQADKQKQLEATVKQLQHKKSSGSTQAASSSGSSSSGGASASGGSGGGNCGSGVSVNSVTSCPFGMTVAGNYRASPSSIVTAYSPVTHITYTMSCSGGTPAVCTGGNGAVVTIY